MQPKPGPLGLLLRAALLLALATFSQLSAAETPAETLAKGGDDWEKPDFCGMADCPEYTVEQKHPDLEVRKYKDAIWVATVVSGHRDANKLEPALHEGVERLGRYLSGENEDGLEMACAVPVAVHYKLGLHPHTGERRNYTVAMYLPYEQQDGAPKPKEEGVFLYASPEATMYVRMFRRVATEVRILKEARALGRALDHAGHAYEAGEVFAAMYGCADSHEYDAVSSGKRRRRHRCRHPHNEIWLHEHKGSNLAMNE